MNFRTRRIGTCLALALAGCAFGAEPAFAVGEPTPTNPPTINDTNGAPPQWGDTLTVNAGTYAPSLITHPLTGVILRRWQRCNASGGACVDITPAATGSSYTLQAADVGNRVRVVERAEADSALFPPVYSADNPSAPTAVVDFNPPDNVTLPTFTGSAQEGRTLTRVSLGTWNDPTPTSYERRWLRCDSAGSNCNVISGATTDSLLLTSADVGHTIRLRVFAVGDFGFRAADSRASAVVVAQTAPTPPPKTTDPTPEPTKLKPFPKIIISGVLRGPGVIIRNFVVKGQRNVKVKIRCRGFSCPYARRTITKRKRRIHIRSLERAFFAGVRLEIRVVKKGRIGKYTRVRIRAGKAPKRIDRCVFPGVTRPRRCP